MMMMSRTQPLGEGRPGLCVAKGGLRVVGGGDAAGKGGSGARARAGHPGGAGCFLSRPRARGGGGGWRKAGPAPPPGIDDSAAGHGHLGQGQRRGRRSADATDGFGGACRRRAPVFRAVSEAKRDRPELRCSRSPCRPPFRILQRRRGPPRRRLFTRSSSVPASSPKPCLTTSVLTEIFPLGPPKALLSVQLLWHLDMSSHAIISSLTSFKSKAMCSVSSAPCTVPSSVGEVN
nr:uncharacterized protein LOC106847054 isoform X5 [Equus asinus]